MRVAREPLQSLGRTGGAVSIDVPGKGMLDDI